MPDGLTAISIFWGALGLGVWLGGRMRDAAWRSTADADPRLYHRGQLYHVIREDDLPKAKRVVERMQLHRLYEKAREAHDGR